MPAQYVDKSGNALPQYFQARHVDPAKVPEDAVTASASGMDPEYVNLVTLNRDLDKVHSVTANS